MKKISLLGSTGSIGTQALEVVRNLRAQGEEVRVEVLAAHSNVALLEAQAREFSPTAVAVFDEKAARSLSQSLKDTGVRVLAGMEGLCQAAAWEGADVTLNSVVGMVGLRPTLAAIRRGKDVALANKETLVATRYLRVGRPAGGGKAPPRGQRTLGHLPVPSGQPRPKGSQKADPHRLRRHALSQSPGGAFCCHPGGGPAPPQLVHGGQDHRGLRHNDEQGPGGHGGLLAF